MCLEIAEQNPHKFRLDYGELESRKQFIRDTRAVIKVSLWVWDIRCKLYYVWYWCEVLATIG